MWVHWCTFACLSTCVFVVMNAFDDLNTIHVIYTVQQHYTFSCAILPTLPCHLSVHRGYLQTKLVNVPSFERIRWRLRVASCLIVSLQHRSTNFPCLSNIYLSQPSHYKKEFKITYVSQNNKCKLREPDLPISKNTTFRGVIKVFEVQYVIYASLAP